MGNENRRVKMMSVDRYLEPVGTVQSDQFSFELCKKILASMVGKVSWKRYPPGKNARVSRPYPEPPGKYHSYYSRVDQYLVGKCVPITLGKGDPVGSIHASGSVDRHLEPPGKSCPVGLCRGREFIPSG